MVRYKIKTRYISRDKLLKLLQRSNPSMNDNEFRIVVGEILTLGCRMVM